MAFERIELNICPTGDMPVFHCSQYDVGRPIIIDLKNGDDAFTPTVGTTFELHCRKVDDNIVTLDTYEVDGNTLTFTSTEQLCACPGDNLCEVAIYLDELCMGTLNFMLHVEPDPLAGGLESETQIYNLTEQIEEITQQVIGDDYYTKVQTDALLDLKADKLTTYTKSEVDTALNLKADKSTTYTKAQVDSALLLKADASNVYTKSETNTLLSAKANVSDLATVATTGDYDDLINKPTIPAAQIQSDYAQADNTKVDYIKNKPDINGMIADALLAVMPVDSAGPSAIVNFNTELAVDLVDCKTTLTPSLTGYTEVNLTVADSEMTPVNTYAIALGDTYYGGTLDVTSGDYDDEYERVDLGTLTWLEQGTGADGGHVFVATSGITRASNADGVITSPWTIENYTSWSSTKKGTVNLGHSSLPIFASDETITDPNVFKTAMYGIYLTYRKATPIVIDLGSGTAVTARAGDNNVYSDTGDTTVQFKDSIQHYIDKKVGS